MKAELIQSVCAWIITFGGAMGIIYKVMVKPIKDFIKEQQRTNKIQNRILVDLLQHTAYGNHVETLKEDLEMLKDEVFK